MDKVVAMTVSPPLPSKNQTRDLNQAAVAVGQQTVSIRTVSLPSPVPAVEATGATVFIGGSAPAAGSQTTCSKDSVPEVQSASASDCQKTSTECPQQHVVKIRINPNNESGQVISSVRLNLDKALVASKTKSNYEEFSEKPNGIVLVCTTNSVETESDGCVRISVVKDTLNNINHVNNLSQCDKNEMIQGSAQEGLNSSLSNSSNCFYYGAFQSPLTNMVMSSGQCSPADTLDSGTCSDLDGTPPPLPKKNSSTIILSGDANAGQHNHHRTGSLTSSGADADSDDNDNDEEDDDDDDNGSNISCDSLNSGDLSGTMVNGSSAIVTEKGLEVQQHVRGFDAKNSNFNNTKVGKVVEVARRKEAHRVSTKLDIILVTENGSNLRNENHEPNTISNYLTSTHSSLSNSHLPSVAFSLANVSGISRVSTPSPSNNSEEQTWSPIVKECTYEERKQEQMRIDQECSSPNYYSNYNNSISGTKYVYDDDRFYKFHLNERCCDDKNGYESMVIGSGLGEGDDKENEYFAGYKILEKEAIRSAKGTVRGVKNRVRAGIATFLQIPTAKNYKAKDAGKVVVYTTTMGIVRETYYACTKVKQILRTHLIKYEERDMFMSNESQTELKDRIGSTTIQVPQLFIDGQYIGDADAVERLNESGELRLLLKPYKSADACTTCKICGGYRLLPCSVCNGSKKSVHRNDFTTEFVALKCMNCNEVGLVRCQHC